MRDWRWILAFTLAMIAVLGGIISLIATVGVARRYTASLNEVRDLAGRSRPSWNDTATNGSAVSRRPA